MTINSDIEAIIENTNEWLAILDAGISDIAAEYSVRMRMLDSIASCPGKTRSTIKNIINKILELEVVFRSTAVVEKIVDVRIAIREYMASVDTTIYQYILVRNDLASLNPGKAVAQGTHAGNKMVWDILKQNGADPVLREMLIEWSNQADGFGTCIALSVSEEELRRTVTAAQAAGIHAGITHDPSYPLQDGSSYHHIPLDTCGYIFGRKCDCFRFVGNFPLMP